MSKPRILFFIGTIVTGGAERHTVLLAKSLMKQGFECFLLGYHSQFSRIVIDDDILPRVRFVGGKSMHNVFEWFRAWSIIREIKPDAIVCVEPSAVPICVVGRKFGFINSRISGIYHSTFFKNAKLKRVFPFIKVAMRYADKLIYVCNAQRIYWEGLGLHAKQIEVIHNGVDVMQFSPESAESSLSEAKCELGLSPDNYVIGLTAVFRPEKNHVQAVDALAAVRRRGIDAKLLLVGGDGPSKADVERRVTQLNLEGHVRYVINPKDVRPYLKAMDVGILCSTSGETFSQAALEMMAMGVPMIMSNISGCVEMVADDIGGRLFDIGDTEGLVGRLVELSDEETRKKASRDARNVVIERYADTVMVEKYAKTLNALCRA